MPQEADQQILNSMLGVQVAHEGDRVGPVMSSGGDQRRHHLVPDPPTGQGPVCGCESPFFVPVEGRPPIVAALPRARVSIV